MPNYFRKFAYFIIVRRYAPRISLYIYIFLGYPLIFILALRFDGTSTQVQTHRHNNHSFASFARIYFGSSFELTVNFNYAKVLLLFFVGFSVSERVRVRAPKTCTLQHIDRH